MSAAKSDVVIVGGGGHAKVVIEILRAAGESVLGFTDRDPAARCGGLARRLGDDDSVPLLHAEGYRRIFVALGGNEIRRRLGSHLLEDGFEVVNAIHPTAVISPSTTLGRGVAVMATAVINAATWVGDFVVVNTGATVDHDCHLGAACHVAPGCHLSGYIRVGEEALLGVGSTVGRGRPMTIGSGAIVGAGSVVVSDVPAGERWAGNPARALRSSTPHGSEA